ncbi:MAG: efflux RND transporter permease subunit [Bacillota bacterium]
MTGEPKNSIVRTNGQTAVVLAVRKEGDANLVQVNQAVLERVEKLEEQLDDVELVVTMNQAKYIQDSIVSIGEEPAGGGGLGNPGSLGLPAKPPEHTDH